MGKVNVCVLPCGHQFHTTCVMKCNNKCPLCRSSIMNEQSKSEKIEVLVNLEDDLVEREIGDDVNEVKLKMELKDYMNKSRLNYVFIDAFLDNYDSVNLFKAYKIRSIYRFGSNLLFDILGYQNDFDYDCIDLDVIVTMDRLMSHSIDALSSDVKSRIEKRVCKSIPRMWNREDVEYKSFDELKVDSKYGYVILDELRNIDG